MAYYLPPSQRAKAVANAKSNSITIDSTTTTYDDEFPLLGAAVKLPDIVFKKPEKKIGPEIIPLFDGKQLILDYHHITRAYDNFAIYRIRMKYLLINQQLHILDSIFLLDTEKGAIFKKFFDYDNLLKNSNILKQCIIICNELQYSNQADLKHIFTPPFEKYASFAPSASLAEKIITDYDPHMACQYYIMLKSSITSNISEVGLSTSLYLSCDDTIGLSTRNIDLDDEVLLSLTTEALSKIFNCEPTEAPNMPYFINLIVPYKNTLYLKYDIEDEIPSGTLSLKIKNLPPNSKIISSIINNPDNYQPDVILIDRQNSILDKNSSYRISEDEYEFLDEELKESYSYEETAKNIFVVDYLFNELLKDDIIQPEMLDSFRDLAEQTSK